LSVLRVDVPEKLEPLLYPARYKGAHGGRGGAKSHFFGEQAVLKTFEGKRVVCIREVQNSIKDSVKQLVESKIAKLGLQSKFEVLRDEVRGPRGGLMVFRGMQDYNADNIKSLEGFDVAWVEEAQSISARSWRLLRPTIRKPESEIWCSWNPRWDTDPVDEFFRGANKPKDAVCVEINWRDNPWFPGVLKDEMDRDFSADPEMAEHVWNGGYEIVSEGAYYARLLAQAEKEGRIGHFPHDPRRKVFTSWDLGISDYTTVWFFQHDGTYVNVIDYYETNGDGFDDVVGYALPEQFIPPPLEHKFDGWSQPMAMERLGRTEPFRYEKHFLPHDVRVREQGAGGRHRHQILDALGLKPLAKGVPDRNDNRIPAVRSMLPITRFHNTPRVQAGLKRLRRFRRKFNDALGTYTTPIHDEASHASDSFGEFAVNCPIKIEVPKVVNKPARDYGFEIGHGGALIPSMDIDQIIKMQRRLKEL